jgi:chromosome segregation ATPase
LVEYYEKLLEEFKEERERLFEDIDRLEGTVKGLKVEVEQSGEEVSRITRESSKAVEDERAKSRNFVNLIKELEKKRSSIDGQNETKVLKEQIEQLNVKIKEIEQKYKIRLEQKDKIIQHLDSKLSEYENK